MKTIYHTILTTPIGQLLIASSAKGFVRILLPNEGNPDLVSRLRNDFPEHTLVEDREKNQKAVDQLNEYFRGARTVFSLPLDLRGTPFQKTVWNAVTRVPYGQTRSYGQIARQVGKPKAFRAVGMANRTNPIPIAVPCHRILGADGSLTGFGGGIPLKEKLLKLEKSS